MAKVPRISGAEWLVMELVWKHTPLSADDIRQKLQPESAWHLKTVHSLVSRLVKKGALQKTKAHGINIFHPLVDRVACLREASYSFLQRYFQVNMAPMGA